MSFLIPWVDGAKPMPSTVAPGQRVYDPVRGLVDAKARFPQLRRNGNRTSWKWVRSARFGGKAMAWWLHGTLPGTGPNPRLCNSKAV